MRAIKPHISHHFACDCREARFEAMEEALRELLTIQAEIHPVWNGEYIPADWVYDIAEKGLARIENNGLAPLPSPCTPDGSRSPEPPS